MTDIGDQFEAFWQQFPRGRKTAKGKARRIFVAIVTGKHKDLKAAPEDLIDGAFRYAMAMGDHHPYVKMPSTWLNGGCWEDEDLTPPASQSATALVTRQRSVRDDLNDRSWAD